MADIYAAGAILVIVSAGFFALGYGAITRLGTRTAVLLGSAAVAALILYHFILLDTTFVLMVLPVSSVIVLGNVGLPCTCFLAGLAGGHRGIPRWRRIAAALVLVFIGAGITFGFLLRKTPPSRNRWDGPVCLQSSRKTCSAAVAATLLTYHGIRADEHEMLRLCFTSDRGTHLLGLYHGLTVKTRGTKWRVAVFETDVPGLKARLTGPAIITVGLPREGHADVRFEERWGW